MLFDKILEIIHRIECTGVTDREFKSQLDFARGVIGNYYDELTIPESHHLLRELYEVRDCRQRMKNKR